MLSRSSTRSAGARRSLPTRSGSYEGAGRPCDIGGDDTGARAVRHVRNAEFMIFGAL